MKVLITGANGYIAQRLVQYLHHKYDITAITRKDFDLTDYNATFSFFQEKYFDAIIHTAIVGGHRGQVDGPEVLEKNLAMYYNLLACRDSFKKLINLGSGAEKSAWTEPYGLSKRIIAESISSKADSYNLRIYGVFDEKELPTRFIRSNLERYIEEQPIIIHRDRYMDFFYMQDLCTVLDYYLQVDDAPKSVDCVYPETLRLVEIADFINQLGPHRVPILIQDQDQQEAYAGIYTKLPVEYVGLQYGIEYTYKKLQR